VSGEFRPILAKSMHRGRPPVTLADHAEDVAHAFRGLFGSPSSPTDLTRNWLRFFVLNAEDGPAFLRNGWVASALHDLGKANDSFQRAVRQPGIPQLIRHEHLTGLLLWEPPVQTWLRGENGLGIDAEIVTSAAVSHHLKTTPNPLDTNGFAAQRIAADDAAVMVLCDAPEVSKTLSIAAEPLNAPPPSLQACAGRWSFAREIEPRRERFLDDMFRFKRALARDQHRRRLLLAVKAALIAADSAGSAVVREGLNLDRWLGEAFPPRPLTGTQVEQLIVEPRIEELKTLGRWHGFHDFQRAAAELGPRALLLASCGSGKTLAAWRWIARQADTRSIRRALFLYPTRATATEGFRDYVSWAGPDEGALISGTAAYDLEGMFATPDDERRGSDYTVRERLFALAYWDRAVFSATVDSFLAFMANRYAPLCLLPVLAESAVVVDEVHSFDKPMFRALENFLATFDVPVLCMTASLPRDRLHTLHKRCGLEVFPTAPDQFADLARQSAVPRYVARRIHEGEAAQGLRQALGEDRAVLCYHSRFRLADRKRRHDDVVRRFRAERAIALATTQVCEMSLDLDADVLITEAAPVPALIQRMGRCCREPLPRDGRLGLVFIYDPERAAPYEPEEVQQGTEFAAAIATLPVVSQSELAERLEQLAIGAPHVEAGFSAFTDSGWYASGQADQFRDDDGYVLDAVLDNEVDAYLAARKARSPTAEGFIVPVPRRLTRTDAQLPEYLRVAEARRYDAEYGFWSEP
jgi:CRISPR-associated endonuclease/helicase Cas3